MKKVLKTFRKLFSKKTTEARIIAMVIALAAAIFLPEQFKQIIEVVLPLVSE